MWRRHAGRRGLRGPVGSVVKLQSALPTCLALAPWAPADLRRPPLHAGDRMIPLGYGKFVRADWVYVLVPLEGLTAGDGRRTYVHVIGLAGRPWPSLGAGHLGRRGDRAGRGRRDPAPAPVASAGGFFKPGSRLAGCARIAQERAWPAARADRSQPRAAGLAHSGRYSLAHREPGDVTLGAAEEVGEVVVAGAGKTIR